MMKDRFVDLPMADTNQDRNFRLDLVEGWFTNQRRSGTPAPQLVIDCVIQIMEVPPGNLLTHAQNFDEQHDGEYPASLSSFFNEELAKEEQAHKSVSKAHRNALRSLAVEMTSRTIKKKLKDEDYSKSFIRASTSQAKEAIIALF